MKEARRRNNNNSLPVGNPGHHRRVLDVQKPHHPTPGYPTSGPTTTTTTIPSTIFTSPFMPQFDGNKKRRKDEKSLVKTNNMVMLDLKEELEGGQAAMAPPAYRIQSQSKPSAHRSLPPGSRGTVRIQQQQIPFGQFHDHRSRQGHGLPGAAPSIMIEEKTVTVSDRYSFTDDPNPWRVDNRDLNHAQEEITSRFNGYVATLLTFEFLFLVASFFISFMFLFLWWPWFFLLVLIFIPVLVRVILLWRVSDNPEPPTRLYGVAGLEPAWYRTLGFLGCDRRLGLWGILSILSAALVTVFVVLFIVGWVFALAAYGVWGDRHPRPEPPHPRDVTDPNDDKGAIATRQAGWGWWGGTEEYYAGFYRDYHYFYFFDGFTIVIGIVIIIMCILYAIEGFLAPFVLYYSGIRAPIDKYTNVSPHYRHIIGP